MAQRKLTADEKRWQADYDADTVARFQEIKNDPARMKAVKPVLDHRAKEMEKRAQSYKQAQSAVSNKKVSTPTKATKTATVTKTAKRGK